MQVFKWKGGGIRKKCGLFFNFWNKIYTKRNHCFLNFTQHSKLIMFSHLIDILQVSPEGVCFMKAVWPFLLLNRKKSNVLSAFKKTFPFLTIFWKISLHSLTNYLPPFMWRKREEKILQMLNSTHQIKKYHICFEFPCYTSESKAFRHIHTKRCLFFTEFPSYWLRMSGIYSDEIRNT